MGKIICFILSCMILSGCAGSQRIDKRDIGKEIIIDKKEASGNIVVFETSRGNIQLELMPDTAPKTCENFIGLVEKGYYNGVAFHRVIKGFMVQGGDPTGTGRGGESFWGTPFEDEFDPDVTFDAVGILAMANAGPNTNGSQFFITTVRAPWLNNKHTIFGRVISGYDVVESIENTQVDYMKKPKKEQVIIKAYVIEDD